MSDSESDSSSSEEEPVPAKASPRARQLVSDFKDSVSGVVNPDLTARLSTYHSVGRWIPVGINPFIKTKDIFLIGIWFRIGPIESHPKRMHLQQQKEESVRFELDCFDRIIQLIPDGLKILEEIAEVKDGIRFFIKYMHKKSANARSDDTKALKKDIGRYLPYDWENDAIVLPVADGKNGKGLTRGFHHSACARNLCPRRLLDEFDMDPKTFMGRVLTGETKIRDKDFPSFLYDETIPYDPHNKDEGLLQGHVLIRAYRHIITGPKTALKPDLIKAKNSRCKSEKIVLTKSDRYTIAYAVSQVYYSISAADNWGPVLSDGFNLQGLYNRVIHFLEDEKDSTVEDIMMFYDTECRFHELKRKEETKKSEIETDTDDELEEIKTTRRLRQRKGTNNDKLQLSHNNTPVDRDVVTVDPRLTVEEEESQPNDFDNPGLSPYSGSQDFDFDDEIEANASMGPATPMSGEPPNSIPDGLNRSQNFSIDPNSFFGFNPNGNFFVPHGINPAQAFNGFVPNGFNLESLKALNSNPGLFYQTRSRHRRDNSEALDSEEERISQQVQGGASTRTSRSTVIPQSAMKAHPPNHSTMQQDESALARANEERRVEQAEQGERGAKRRKKAVAPSTDRVTRPRK